jgi:hypothetical protein
MEITPHPVTPQPATPICDKPIWQRSSDTICIEPRADGRDCSGISAELDLFFPLIFDDCFTRPAANAARLQAKYATVKTWDRYIPSSQRYINRTLQACNGCILDPYRLIAKDHDANGGSNGGSICYFNKTRSDCETTAGEHYQLKAGSIKAFLNIANEADPDADAGASPQLAKPPQPNIPPIGQVKPARTVKSLTPDEVAMITATSIVGETQCGIKGNAYPMNLAVAKLGQDLVDFQPDGRYAPLVQVKVKKGLEWINGLGKEKGCEGIRQTLIKFLPDIYAQK